MAERRSAIRSRGSVLVLLAAAIALFAGGGQARAADLGIGSYALTTSTSQAGGHPDLTTTFTLTEAGVGEAARNVAIDAPTGIFGNAGTALECTSSDFSRQQCVPNSQVGVITVHARYGGEPNYTLGSAPVYYLEPGPDQTGLLAFVVPTLEIPIQIPISVRTGSDFGLRFTVSELTQLAPLTEAKLTLWGFPGDKSHEDERFPKGSLAEPSSCPGNEEATCSPGAEWTLPNRPLTDNPTVCAGAPLTARLEVQTYQQPEDPRFAESPYPATTGCENETFNPALGTNLTTVATDSPTGLDLDISAPQPLGLALSPSELRSAIVTLPPELTINPDAADGQSACTDAQARFGTTLPAECPDSAKIGTVSIGSPALTGPLEGSLYIGEPLLGNQYRIFLVADGYGVHAKLVGSFVPDPVTGRVSARLEDLPQVPFDHFQLHLFASDRALFATPIHCSLYQTEADFVPWNASLPDIDSTGQLGLTTGPGGAACPAVVRPFNPRLIAGTSVPTAGAHSSFTLRLDREDGDQYLGKLNFTLPQGLTASIRGIPYCPATAIAAAANNSGRAEAAAPSCPAASQIGTSNVAAGPGAHPFHAVGRIYLAGPFNGAPLSLAVVTPALAGPYDYGVVVVRVALNVDPHDAHVIADSEVVPSIIGGIPLRLRSIQVNLDRPNFMINPTNCNPFAIASQGIGDQGTIANFSSYFRAVNCETLPFKPRMTITQVGARKANKRNQDPSLRFDLYTRPGDANLKSVAVTLPKAFEVDQRHLSNICSRSQLQSERCAGRQPIGSVRVMTPLLEAPLTGLAYAVSGFGKLPHLAFILAGQVTLVPEAESAAVHGGHLRTTVPVVPDAPIGHFQLTLLGGKHGYLINTRALCASPAVTTVQFQAQNGDEYKQRVTAKTACGGHRHRSK